MSNILIKITDKDCNNEYKSWGTVVSVSYRDVLKSKLSEREMRDVLESKLRLVWSEFLAVLQTRGIKSLRFKESDKSTYESSVLMPTTLGTLVIYTKFIESSCSYELHSEVNCDYTDDLRLDVQPL